LFVLLFLLPVCLVNEDVYIITRLNALRQPRGKTSRQNACEHDRHSVTDDISRRVTSGR